MSVYREMEDISNYPPRTFYLFGIGTDLEAIQFSYFLGVIKALIAQPLKNNKMPAVDA